DANGNWLLALSFWCFIELLAHTAFSRPVILSGAPRLRSSLVNCRARSRRIPWMFRATKQILAWTATEATIHLRDYWIDTDHLLLGIIRARTCTASSYLKMIGLTLRGARKTIRDNKHSRPNYGPAPACGGS